MITYYVIFIYSICFVVNVASHIYDLIYLKQINTIERFIPVFFIDYFFMNLFLWFFFIIINFLLEGDESILRSY